MLPFYLFVGILLAIILFLFVIGLSLPGRLPFVIEGKHAVITGGSKGIGRCIAEQLLEEGCKIVSIIARDLEALEKAKNEILQLGFEENSVKIYSCDLNSGQKIIKDLIEKIIADSGPIDLLINNAGTCIQNAFDELPEDAFEKQMKTNFFSAVYMTRAVLPQMKERRCGHISFVSSAAGQCAIWGYSAYSPSKFAVRAFADVLYMELLPYEIGVSVLFPPNTATEGFDEELKNMPEQVRQISNSAGVFPPKQVAAALIRSIRMGDFWTCVGLEGKMLGFLSAAASPETNFVNAVMQIFFAGIIRGIMLIYTAQFNAIIKNCYKKAK
uniref:3-dehydrosphinganine reductase n=2 Tax=Meloidogyne incognita TaxID=6306 RepID=A0A914LV11_MELIC